jgi:DNA-binding CsgD family transcriptional regulator
MRSPFLRSGPEDQRNLRNQYWTEVQAARAEYFRATEKVDYLVRQQGEPGTLAREGIAPLGMQRVVTLGNEQRLAFEKYKKALAAYRSLFRRHSIPTPNGVTADLTIRERQVLILIADGRSSKQIASQLGIAFKTVVSHRTRISMKLDAHNSAELTRSAIRMGLVEP